MRHGLGFHPRVNFKLGVGDGVVLTLHPGKAKYMGFQLTDPWKICPNNARSQACLRCCQDNF
jgi:hypothetical protein